jgi:3-dehydroquinate dehydratase-1
MSADLVRSLHLDRTPRVVGTIITADFLRAWNAQPSPLPCDLVELRADGFSDFPGWIEIGQKIEARGTPVFATVRMSAEGGKWTAPEAERLRILEAAMDALSGIDVELQSSLAEPLARRAAHAGKLCILSFHDFKKTAPREELAGILSRMQALGSIAKIAAAANSGADVETLRSLLREGWEKPVCIIGMGSQGRETRLQFPREGSCLTYGYLDVPGAPGQYSARELMQHFGRAAS